jgi:hypothetical protein
MTSWQQKFAYRELVLEKSLSVEQAAKRYACSQHTILARCLTTVIERALSQQGLVGRQAWLPRVPSWERAYLLAIYRNRSNELVLLEHGHAEHGTSAGHFNECHHMLLTFEVGVLDPDVGYVLQLSGCGNAVRSH